MFKVHKLFTQLLISLFFLLGAGDVFTQDKVLNIYFCGTSMTEDMWEPGKAPWDKDIVFLFDNPNPSELIATLYHNDNSVAIKKTSIAGGIVTKVEIPNRDSHYKYIVNGLGTDDLSLLGVINPNWGVRNWNVVTNEGLMALDLIIANHPEEKVLLNLIGFSRGGILCMKMARRVASDSRVSKINILAFDPVPGDLDPIYRHGNDLRLPAKVKQYVGIYAQDERSFMFEPIIPDFDEIIDQTKVWLVSVPGGHETMVGNCQLDGHSLTITLHDFIPFEEGMKHVNNVVTAMAEQLITSKSWGGFENKIRNLTQFSNKNEFQTQIELMYGFKNWGPLLTTSFIIIGTLPVFSGHDLLVYPSEDSFLRLAGLAPKRLCFKAPYRYSPSLNHDQVFWLDKYVDSIKTDAWDKLQSLRGDYDPPIPTVDPLPDILGECMAEVTTIPTAYDEYTQDTINGTTSDPLIYTEQGTYTVTWSYDDGNGNVATQEQTVIVEDVTPPTIEKLLGYSFTIYPSNYITEEVPQWPVNYKNGVLAERPRKRLNRDDFMLLRHQRKFETIKVDELVESVSDNCSSLTPEDVIITKVTCDEAKDSRIPVRLRNEDDIIIADDCKSVDLRREFDFRDNGRVYTVHLSLKDEVGNEAIETCQFCVLVSAPAKMAIADAPAYEAHSTCYETDGQPTDMVAGISTKSSISEEKNLDKKEIVPEVGFIKNYPNPFNSYTTFAFGVTEKSDVTLSIYNMQGQLIRVLYSGSINPGSMSVDWDGTDASGNKMTSGIYIYRLLANNTVVSSGKTVLKK